MLLKTIIGGVRIFFKVILGVSEKKSDGTKGKTFLYKGVSIIYFHFYLILCFCVKRIFSILSYQGDPKA